MQWIEKETGWKFFLLAMGTFAGIALEFVHWLTWESVIYGSSSFTDWQPWQGALHWIITCISWGLVAYLLHRVARNKLGFDLMKKGEKMKRWQIATAVFAIVLSSIVAFIDWGGVKIIKEFQNYGPAGFALQHLYYAVEIVMVLLIIIFAQKALEIWTKKPNVPWGGIICGLTWGIGHILSRGYFDPANGIMSMLLGFMFGAAYLLTNRDAKKSWLILFLMFTL